MLRLAFDFIITWRETRTRPNAYATSVLKPNHNLLSKFPTLVTSHKKRLSTTKKVSVFY